MGKPRKPRSDAKMYQLPKAILQGVDERLVNYNMSYADIRAWLAEKGYTVSQASLSRYAFKVFEAAQRIADDLEKTKAVVDFIGRNPDLDTTEATSAILKSGLLQKISSAKEEFNDMPIKKAGRLFVQLSKAEADRKRTAAAVKKKAELALDAMNDDILDAIKHHLGRRFSKEQRSGFLTKKATLIPARKNLQRPVLNRLRAGRSRCRCAYLFDLLSGSSI